MSRLDVRLEELHFGVLSRGGLPTAMHTFDEVDHPRAHGKFAHKLGGMQPGDRIRLPSGVEVHKTFRGSGRDEPLGYQVTKGSRTEFHADKHSAADRALQWHQHSRGGIAGRYEDDTGSHFIDTHGRKTRLAAALIEAFGEPIEEWPLHSGGTLMRLQFDPGQHPRDRLGQFTEVLSKLRRSGSTGSSVALPHGVRVLKHRGGFVVEHRSGGTRLTSAPAAAADALGHFDKAAGVDPAASFLSRMAELRSARAATLSDFGADSQHLEGLMRAERGRHNPSTAQPEIGKHRGRRQLSMDSYRAAHPSPGLAALIRNSDEITAALGRVRARRAAPSL